MVYVNITRDGLAVNVVIICSGASSTGRPTVAQALEQQEQQLRQQLQQQQQQQQQLQQLPVSLAETLQPGHMTREELERHLEYKQSTKPQFMSIDKAPNMLPDDIFNDENSNSERYDFMDIFLRSISKMTHRNSAPLFEMNCR